jgi:hypothetical protein
MIETKTIADVISLWKADKKQYVKKSSFSAYVLLIENHLLPVFGRKYDIEEPDIQTFVFQKLEEGLSQKSVKPKFRIRFFSGSLFLEKRW